MVKHTPKANFTPDCEALRANFSLVSEQIEKGNILSAYAIGFGGVAEALAKMSFGNEVGVNVNLSEGELFDYNYGSILVEATAPIEGAILVGETVAEKSLTINGEVLDMAELYRANTERFEKVYPARCLNGEPCQIGRAHV